MKNALAVTTPLLEFGRSLRAAGGLQKQAVALIVWLADIWWIAWSGSKQSSNTHSFR